MTKLTADEVNALSYNDLGAALKERNLEIPAKKEDRVAALLAAEADISSDETTPPATDDDKKAPEQLGFAKRAGLKSTAPERPAPMERPYLDSPRDFGIHINGLLVRFKKGRTPITDDAVLEALKTDSYVADNGAEVVE